MFPLCYVPLLAATLATVRGQEWTGPDVFTRWTGDPYEGWTTGLTNQWREVISTTSPLLTSTYLMTGTWLEINGYRLGSVMENGAYPVEARTWWDAEQYGPVCDDRFDDRTAHVLCWIHGHTRGHRTSYETELEFISTSLTCWNHVMVFGPGITYDGEEFFRNRDYETPHVSYFGQFSDNCAAQEYKLEEFGDKVLPCTKDQAAAVFCYQTREETRYEVHSVETKTVSKKKFTVTVGLKFVKVGEKIDLQGKDVLKDPDHKIGIDFGAVACGKDQKVDLTVSKSNSALFELKGKFGKRCKEDVDLLHMGEIFWTVKMKS